MLPIEKETIITYNEGDDTAEVFTYNRGLQNKLAKLAEANPLEVVMNVTQNRRGGEFYVVPKSYVKISPPKTRNCSDEERARRSERMRAMRSAQQRI